jgi:hypothetical protein
LGSDNGIKSSALNNKVTDFTPLSADPPPTTTIIAKADSGASSHYFKQQDERALANLRPTHNGPNVLLPDSTTIQATHEGQLKLHPSLSAKASTAHILDGITNASLISLGQLCDNNCVTVLDKKKLQVFKDTVCILQGDNNKHDGL